MAKWLIDILSFGFDGFLKFIAGVVSGFLNFVGGWFGRLLLLSGVIGGLYWIIATVLGGMTTLLGVDLAFDALEAAYPGAYALGRWLFYLFALDVAFAALPVVISARVILRRLTIPLL